MKKEIDLSEILQPPEFEISAKKFIKEVRAEASRCQDEVEISADDVDSLIFGEGLSALRDIVEDDQEATSSLDYLVGLADQESARRALVVVYISGLDFVSVSEAADRIEELSLKYQGPREGEIDIFGYDEGFFLTSLEYNFGESASEDSF